MNGDGKFNGGKYTTIPETKNIKLPIGGKIRLGIRVKNEQGMEYPKELDYFVCPKEVRAVFGDEPTELTVFFPRNNREEVFPQCYEKYGSNEALLCQGDGEKSAQRLNLENGRWEEVKCPCEHYNKKYDKKTKIGGCVKAGYLKFMIPSVSIGTFYQCRVGGVVSIEECNSAFELAKDTTGGCWAMIPFRMKRVAKKLKIPGTANMKTHWVVTLEIAASTEEIRRVMSGEILYLGQQRNKQFELESTGPAMGKEIEAVIEVETAEEIKAREAKEAEEEKARQEALIKEYDKLNEQQAKLKKEIEEGKHKLKSYEEAKAIHKNKQEEKEEIESAKEINEEPELATQPQKDTIYGNVVCEECGTRVYGFRCPKCQNLDLHVIDKGFYRSHLMIKDDFKKEMKPTMLPDKLTKIEAIKIYSWWRGDKKKMIVGERIKRESKEKEAEPEATKEERIKAAREIVGKTGKLEVKDEDAPFPDEKIADEDIPGSSINKAIPFEGKRKAKATE